MMATNSKEMDPSSQKNLKDKSLQAVAVYRFVIVDGKACIDDNPDQGIWIFKPSTNSKHTHTAYLARKGWKAYFECVYSDTGALTGSEILDLNDDLKKSLNWEPAEKEGDLERGRQQEASGVTDKQNEEQGKISEWEMMLETPKNRGGPKDDNNNDLLRFELVSYPLGINGARREDLALWWAKKEVSGRPITVLSEAELERFKIEGKIVQTETFRFLGPIIKVPASVFEGGEASWDR